MPVHKTKSQKRKTAYSTLVSYLGRVMYNYDNRYYLTASIRADGSSRFPKGNKYAIFHFCFCFMAYHQ